uniref:RGM_N domain-containing protein n=1 Tax=Steinernema glaseri TaxID=37863 RepID=A0A1I8A8W0_9BILA
MSGCLHLTEWQVQDLEMSRRRAELLTARVGASLLCEDSSNFTTCVCNRRDKCNDIHARNPFSTYTGNVFGGIINFDSTRSSGTGYRRAYTRSSSTSQRLSCALSVFMLLCSILL